MITVEGVTKFYGDFKAVDNLSFELKKGEVVGFLGPNGAGKTTTMRLLTGYLPASSGTCRVAGFDVRDQSLQARRHIGYLPESNALYGNLEVIEYLEYMGSLQNLEVAALRQGLREVVATCGLKKVLGKKIATLSKGYRQRVGLAQALIHHPDVLILDEPTVGLDPNQIGEIRQLIKDVGQDRTVLLSTHILSEVEQTCERVIIIADGKITAQGTPRELMSRTQGKAIYYVSIRAPRAELESSLVKIPGFISAEWLQENDGVHSLKILSEEANDQSEIIFRLVVAQQWTLTELRKERLSLEAVFKQLTA